MSMYGLDSRFGAVPVSSAEILAPDPAQYERHPLLLQSQWAYYPTEQSSGHSHGSQPSFRRLWGYTQGVYQLTVQTDAQPLDYALALPVGLFSYDLRINGEVVAAAGAFFSPGAAPPRSLICFTAEGQSEVVLQISGQHPSFVGYTPPLFGAPSTVHRRLLLRGLCWAMLCGIAVATTLFCAVWQLYSRPVRPFFLFTLCFSLYCALSVAGIRDHFSSVLFQVCHFAMLGAILFHAARLRGLSGKVIDCSCIFLLLPLLSPFLFQGSAAPWAGIVFFGTALVIGTYLLLVCLLLLRRERASSVSDILCISVVGAALIFDAVCFLFPLQYYFNATEIGFTVFLTGTALRCCRSTALQSREIRTLREQMLLARQTAVSAEAALQDQAAYGEQIRKLAHDYKNSLLLFQIWLEDRQYDRLQRHLAEALEGMPTQPEVSYTGNHLIDSLIQYSLHRAELLQINFSHVLAPVPQGLSISEEDLTSLLLNILSNALEACERIAEHPARWVKLSIQYERGAFVISCDNACRPETIKHRANRYVTAKAGRTSHGYGLRIIEEIVKRHGGILDISHSGGTFSLYAGINIGVSQQPVKK